MNRILVVDDHDLVRETIASALNEQPDFDVLMEAVTNGEEAVEAIPRLKPEVVLMDVSMPKMDGLEATRIIKDSNPEIQIIMLTVRADEDFVVRAVLNGASGYLLKTIKINDLIDNIRSVLRGDNILDPKATKAILKTVRGETVEILSEREREILRLTSEGYFSKEIASKLGLSVHTVKAHFQRIFQKLGASDKAHAVSLAIRRGII